MVLRAASSALATALAGNAQLWEADLFEFTLVDGVTNYFWTNWPVDLTCAGQLYSSRAPWLNRSKWNVSNDMEVPTMTVTLMAQNTGFNGGANIKTQIHNGLFDGASFLFSMAFMTAPGQPDALGAVQIFGGVTGAIDITGNQAVITCRGKNNLLDQYVPRNLFQIGCNHAFCDAGCTLSRTAYTSAFVAGSGATTVFVPWSGSAPSNYANYVNGTVVFVSGVASGQRRTVQAASSAGLTLVYPLLGAPAVGDHFTAFQGCDKTVNSGSGQSCSDRGNTQHYRGFPFVPPPSSAY